MIPTFLVGLGFGLYLKYQRADIYQEIGKTVLEETHERVLTSTRGARGVRGRSGHAPRVRPATEEVVTSAPTQSCRSCATTSTRTRTRRG